MKFIGDIQKNLAGKPQYGATVLCLSILETKYSRICRCVVVVIPHQLHITAILPIPLGLADLHVDLIRFRDLREQRFFLHWNRGGTVELTGHMWILKLHSSVREDWLESFS